MLFPCVESHSDGHAQWQVRVVPMVPRGSIGMSDEICKLSLAELDTRSRNRLVISGRVLVGDLNGLRECDVRRMRNSGPITIVAIAKFMRSRGIELQEMSARTMLALDSK